MNYYHEKRYKISKKNSYSNDLHNKLNNRTIIIGKQVLTNQVKQRKNKFTQVSHLINGNCLKRASPKAANIHNRW